MIDNFYDWTLTRSIYNYNDPLTLIVNSSSKITVDHRANYLYYYSTDRFSRTYSTNYFKDCILNFKLTLTSIEEYCSSMIFSMSGGSNYSYYSIGMRIYGGNIEFKLLWTGGQYSGVTNSFSIPLSSLPMSMYFTFSKSNDLVIFNAYSNSNRSTLLGGTSITHYAISEYDETSISLATSTAYVTGDPSPRYITYSIEDFDIVSTSSSSSFSSSSSCRSSSSSSSYSVDPVATLNDIGIKDGSYSSSSSSMIRCQYPDLRESWEVEVSNGTSYAAWSEENQRWDSVHVYGSYSWVELNSKWSWINEVCTQRFDNTVWQPDSNAGTWNAGSNRWEPYNGGWYYRVTLRPLGTWDDNYYATKVKFTLVFPTSPVNPVEMYIGTSNITDYYNITSGVEYTVNLTGNVLMNGIQFDSYDYVNFYVTNIIFCTAEKSGWPIGYAPNEMKFTPTFRTTQNATFDYIVVGMSDGSYSIYEQYYDVVSGVEVSLPMSLFFSPKYIDSVMFYIYGNDPFTDYSIDDLYFCGSASSSSFSSSSSCRSSSSSSSSNGNEWEFVRVQPLSTTPISQNGPIVEYTNNYQYKGNSYQMVDTYDDYLYYHEYKDGQWTPQEQVYSPLDSVNESRPVNNQPQYMTEFDGRPAFVATYPEYDSEGGTRYICDLNYKNGSNVWIRERANLGSQNPDVIKSYPSPKTVAFSPNANYMAITYENNSPYIKMFKRNGDQFERLTTNAPDTIPVYSSPDYRYISCQKFSPDGNYFVVGLSKTPFIYIYKRTGDQFLKLSDPGVLPTSGVACIAWSSDSTYLCVGHTTSPRVTIYKRAADVFTKLANPGSLPGSQPIDILFSPNDSHLAISMASSPYFFMYNRSGDVFTKQSDLATPLPSQYSMTWAADSSYMVFVRTDVYTYENHIVVYMNSSGVLTLNGTAYSLQFNVKPRAGTTNYVRSAKITPDGQFLVCLMYASYSPTIVLYQISAGPTFTYVTNDTFQDTQGSYPSYDISNDSQYIMVTSNNDQTVAIYKRDGNTFNRISNNGGMTSGTLVLAQQTLNGDFHIVCKDWPGFTYIKRTYATGVWTKEIIKPTLQGGFWEYQPFSPSSTWYPRCKMDVNGNIHLAYYAQYHQMPTTGNNPTLYTKVVYVTNRTGSWVRSEVYSGFSVANTNYFLALAIDSDINVYIIFNENLSSETRIRVAKLPLGGAWTVQLVALPTPSNTVGSPLKAAVYNNKLYAFGLTRFYVFNATTLDLLYSYNPAEIQTDSLPVSDLPSYDEYDRESWINLDGNDLRIKFSYGYPSYNNTQEKIYKLEFSNSSSSRSSTSRVSSSSSSSSLESQADLWIHDIETFTNYATAIDMTNEPHTNKIHAFVTNTAGNYSYWFNKPNPILTGDWELEMGSLYYNNVPYSIFVSSSKKRYILAGGSNNTDLVLLRREPGGAGWYTDFKGFGTIYGACMVEDSNGFIHILYTQTTYAVDYSYYTNKVVHVTNTTGSWVSEVAYTRDIYVNPGSRVGGISAVILSDNTIHCAFLYQGIGVIHLYGTTGSWNNQTLSPELAFSNSPNIKLRKAFNSNNIHFAGAYAYGHKINTGNASITYAYFNGATWTIEEDITETITYSQAPINLLIDSANKPHIILKNSGYLIEWVKDPFWRFVTKEGSVISNSAPMAATYSRNYLNALTTKSIVRPFYSKRLLGTSYSSSSKSTSSSSAALWMGTEERVGNVSVTKFGAVGDGSVIHVVYFQKDVYNVVLYARYENGAWTYETIADQTKLTAFQTRIGYGGNSVSYTQPNPCICINSSGTPTVAFLMGSSVVSVTRSAGGVWGSIYRIGTGAGDNTRTSRLIISSAGNLRYFYSDTSSIYFLSGAPGADWTDSSGYVSSYSTTGGAQYYGAMDVVYSGGQNYVGTYYRTSGGVNKHVYLTGFAASSFVETVIYSHTDVGSLWSGSNVRMELDPYGGVHYFDGGIVIPPSDQTSNVWGVYTKVGDTPIVMGWQENGWFSTAGTQTHIACGNSDVIIMSKWSTYGTGGSGIWTKTGSTFVRSDFISTLWSQSYISPIKIFKNGSSLAMVYCVYKETPQTYELWFSPDIGTIV